MYAILALPQVHRRIAARTYRMHAFVYGLVAPIPMCICHLSCVLVLFGTRVTYTLLQLANAGVAVYCSQYIAIYVYVLL